jgi:hypothetical protein
MYLFSVLSICAFAAGLGVLWLVCRGHLQSRHRAVPFYGALAAVGAAAPALTVPFSWSDVIGVVGVFMALAALGIAFATPKPLAAYLSRERRSGDPEWWPGFERAFWNYVRKPPYENPFRGDAIARARARSRARTRQRGRAI